MLIVYWLVFFPCLLPPSHPQPEHNEQSSKDGSSYASDNTCDNCFGMRA